MIDDDRTQALFSVGNRARGVNDAFLQPIHTIIHYREEEVPFSAGNEMIDAGLSDPDSVRDIAHRGGIESLVAKELGCYLVDLIQPSLAGFGWFARFLLCLHYPRILQNLPNGQQGF